MSCLSLLTLFVAQVLLSAAKDPHLLLEPLNPALNVQDLCCMQLSPSSGYKDDLLSVYENYKICEYVRSALVNFPKTRWKEGIEVYERLYAYAEGMSTFIDFSLTQRMDSGCMCTEVTLERFRAFFVEQSEEEKRLRYFTLVLPQIASLFVLGDCLLSLGSAWQEDAQKTFQYLSKILSQIHCAIDQHDGYSGMRVQSHFRELYPILFGSGLGVRLVCAKVVDAFSTLGCDFTYKACKVFSLRSNDLSLLLSRIIETNSSRLAAERSRMEFIVKFFPSSEHMKRFNVLIDNNNMVVGASQIGQKFDYLSAGSLPQTGLYFMQSIRHSLTQLVQLGPNLCVWEKETIRDALEKVVPQLKGHRNSCREITVLLKSLPCAQSLEGVISYWESLS